MIREFIEKVERERIKEDICIEARKKDLEELMDLVKRGILKPTVAANPIKGTINLYKPSGEGRVHVVVRENEICFHYDSYDPAKEPVKHLLNDTEIKEILKALAMFAMMIAVKKLFRKAMDRRRGAEDTEDRRISWQIELSLFLQVFLSHTQAMLGISEASL